jgi:hypothetical protein
MKNQISPSSVHPVHAFWDGMLILMERIHEEGPITSVWFCNDCHHSFVGDCLPKFTLVNNMWIGSIPPQFLMLTLPKELLISCYYSWCYVVKLYSKAWSWHQS